MSLLGGVLVLGLEAFYEVADIEERHFYLPRHQAVWRAVRALALRNEPIDIVTVELQLRAQGEQKLVSLEELHQLSDRGRSTLRLHARIVRELAALRALVDVAREVIEGAERAESVPEYLNTAEAKILAACEQRVQHVSVGGKQLVELVFTDVRRRAAGEIVAIETGLVDFDKATGGLQPGELWIVAGRPSSGKTALAIATVEHNSVEHHNAAPIPSLLFSLEMSALQIGQRLMAAEARVNMQRIRTAQLLEEDWARLVATAPHIARGNVEVDDTSALQLLDLAGRARVWRRTKARHAPIGVIIVDYLQLARGSGRHELREQELAELSRGLKHLAKELKVPVIALSQLNRKCEERELGRPQLSDLRESGAIEQDADGVVLVWRPEKYLRPDKPSDAPRLERWRGKAVLIIAKARNGATPDVEVAFQDQWTRFENLARAT